MKGYLERDGDDILSTMSKICFRQSLFSLTIDLFCHPVFTLPDDRSTALLPWDTSHSYKNWSKSFSSSAAGSTLGHKYTGKIWLERARVCQYKHTKQFWEMWSSPNSLWLPTCNNLNFIFRFHLSFSCLSTRIPKSARIQGDLHILNLSLLDTKF